VARILTEVDKMYLMTASERMVLALLRAVFVDWSEAVVRVSEMKSSNCVSWVLPVVQTRHIDFRTERRSCDVTTRKALL